jgi:hypothetical protein
MSTALPESCAKGSKVTLYYNVGTSTTPVWVEHVGMVEDLNMPETEELSELSGRRTNRLVKEYNEGEIEISITGTQLTSPDYEGWQFLNSMRAGGISRDVMCLSNKIGVLGAYGWRGDFRNGDRSLNGPASGSQTNTVDLKPAAPCHPDWVPVRVVKVAVADTAADFDPTVFEAAE